MNLIATAVCPSFTMDLTLTSVVFECNFGNRIFIKNVYLTLTSVVFEFGIIREMIFQKMYLTLTSVVFEYV